MSPIRVDPPIADSSSNGKKRGRTAYLMTGPQTKKSRACRLALESGPASVGAGISVGAFRVSHVSIIKPMTTNPQLELSKRGLRLTIEPGHIQIGERCRAELLG